MAKRVPNIPMRVRYANKLQIKKINFLFLLLLGLLCVNCSKYDKDAKLSEQSAQIFPQYYELTLPPNIAPLNFIIQEKGSKFRVEISGTQGKKIVIHQNSSTVQISIKAWHRLLKANAGNTVSVDIWSYHNEVWTKFKTISHHIATEEIDPYMVYRLVNAVYLNWRDMGIYQRNLTNFEETPLIKNKSIDHGCVNCHSFAQNDPSKMMIHFRILNSGTAIWNDGVLKKVNTKTTHTPSAGIYPAWHPMGKYIAFSVGSIKPHLTTRTEKIVDVSDGFSDLVIYDVEKNEMQNIPQLSSERRENMPTWSPDGKTLYFISAPEAEEGDLEARMHSQYDLMRITFDSERNVWGEVELVLSAAETGKSISMPRVSPNGKYLICSMSDFGYFTIYHKGSDLHLLDLETKEYHKLGLNSENSESHSCWSSNGHWLVFSSKSIDGVYTRPHLAYIDEKGMSGTPFVLPQKDPAHYNHLLSNYNRPELITGKVHLSENEMRDMVYTKAEDVK
ncbi:MAG: TolB family protein [Prolixibacteraceae bacterium]